MTASTSGPRRSARRWGRLPNQSLSGPVRFTRRAGAQPMPSTGLGVYASAFLGAALAAGFRAAAFFAPAFFATGFFAVFLATFFFAMRGSLPQHSLIGQFTPTGPVRYTGQDSLRQPISQNIHS